MGSNPLNQQLTATPKAWRANTTLHIPATDIVSFAFARCHHYDDEKPVYIDAKTPSCYVTARQARSVVTRLSAGLAKHGIKPGDCVSIHSFNNILYPLLWLGVAATKACLAPANPAYSTAELLHHFKITQPRYVLVHIDCFKTVATTAITAGIDPSNIFIFDSYDGLDGGSQPPSPSGSENTTAETSDVGRLSHLLETGEASWGFLPSEYEASDRTVCFATTSGTTGLPKAAAISHRYLVAQCATIENQFVGRTEQISQLVCLPVFHAFAAQLALVLPLRTGIPTYFLPRFRTNDYVEAINRYSITDSAIVPPIITELLSLSEDQYVKLRSLRYVICAGAPMNPEVQARLYRFLSPKVIISQCWGATEAGWITLFGPTEKDTSGSVGRLLPNAELKIIDETTGEPITEEGKTGEGCIRSTSMFRGYENNGDATTKAIDNEGFYHTGDRIWILKGKVFIGGRIKDTMKVNGWQVSPEELEEIIIRHCKIIDCAVVGITQKDKAGIDQTLPRAYVVIAKGTEASEKEIQSFVASQVVGYKRLTGGVVFVPHIPRNPTGKILRRLLSDN